jgi:hypothetical protein
LGSIGIENLSTANRRNINMANMSDKYHTVIIIFSSEGLSIVLSQSMNGNMCLKKVRVGIPIAIFPTAASCCHQVAGQPTFFAHRFFQR